MRSLNPINAKNLITFVSIRYTQNNIGFSKRRAMKGPSTKSLPKCGAAFEKFENHCIKAKHGPRPTEEFNCVLSPWTNASRAGVLSLNQSNNNSEGRGN